MWYLSATCNSRPGLDRHTPVAPLWGLEMLHLSVNRNSQPKLNTFLLDHSGGLEVLYLSVSCNSQPGLNTLLWYHSGELEMVYLSANCNSQP